MKRKFLLFLFLTLCFSQASYAASQKSSDVNLKVELNQAFATIGDQVVLTVSVTYPSKTLLLNFGPNNPVEPFQVREVKILPTITLENDKRQEGKEYHFTVFQVGEFILGPVQVTYLDADKKQTTLESDKLYLTVESVLKNEKDRNDIRDIKPVVGIKSRYLIYIIGLLVAILSIAAFFYIKQFLRKKELERLNAQVILSPHDEAYQLLTKLKNSTLPREGKIKEFYVQLSDVIRRYLSRRYLIEISDLTTFELLGKLKEVQTEGGAYDLVGSILRDCDFVKFAKYEPSYSETREHLNLAFNLVDRTKIVVPEPIVEPLP
jgi:hypothetical protein